MNRRVLAYPERVSDLEKQFLQAIAKNPDDEEARSVYADWLEQRGDPRGEYLRLDRIVLRNADSATVS